MKYAKGNLVKDIAQFDVVLHSCNCFHTMGAGVARQLREAYPEVYLADYHSTKYADRGKMGTYSKADIGGTVVLNCYAQYDYDATKKPFDYDAFRKVLVNVKREYSGKKIGMPMIGAGLAGGDWKEISKIIREELDGEDVTVVCLELPPDDQL